MKKLAQEATETDQVETIEGKLDKKTAVFNISQLPHLTVSLASLVFHLTEMCRNVPKLL